VAVELIGPRRALEVAPRDLRLPIAGPWTAGGSGEKPGDAEEGIEVEMLPLVLSLAPCGGAEIFSYGTTCH